MLSRRFLLAAVCFSLVGLALLVAPSADAADEDLTVLKSESAPGKMLSQYLLARCKEHFDARRAAIAALKTPEDLHRRQEELKGRFIAAIGGFPPKTPLAGKTVGTDKRDGYTMEKVIYESRPNHQVTANLYLPEGKGPFPGVIVPCGHSANGKGADAYQRVCILLAKNGIAALIYDPIGQGERSQLLDPPGKPVAGSTTEHTLVGVGGLLVGQGTASYRIWDGIRSLDYLAGRPEIDPKRLGCTGNSGGGTLTSYLMALDERIVAAAPSCYITSLERLFATLGPQDAEQNIPGQVAFGMEHADYITMRAPRPTLILLASGDFFDPEGSWTTFREAKQLYGLLGFSERVDVAEYNTKHGYGKGQRESMARFMRRWLLHKDDVVVEGTFTTAKDKDLLCTRTGQVLEDFKGKSAFQLTAERDRELASQRAKFLARKPDDAQKEVRRLLGLPTSGKPAAVKAVGDLRRDGYRIVKYVIETEPGITIPALLFTPIKEGQLPFVFYLHGEGKSADAAPGGAIEQRVKAGNHVFALDVRGLGETAPGALNPLKPGYFGMDFKESFLGIHLNRPLLGQKVYDLLATLQAVTSDQRAKNISAIEVIGIGSAGPVALHAAALEPRIKKVTLERSLVSWSAVTQSARTYNQLTNVVPGVLQHYDLPELAAALAPRPLTIKGAVDAMLKPLPASAVEQAYRSTKAAYTAQNAATALKIED